MLNRGISHLPEGELGQELRGGIRVSEGKVLADLEEEKRRHEIHQKQNILWDAPKKWGLT